MNPLFKAFWIAKGVGWDNVPRRVYQSVVQKSGILRRRLESSRFEESQCPLSTMSHEERFEAWNHRITRFLSVPPREELAAFVASQRGPGVLPGGIKAASGETPGPREEDSLRDWELWDEQVIGANRRALAGYYPMFSHWESLLGWPPNFQRDTTNDITWPVGPHWTESTRSGPPYNDLKLVWEPSRLSLIYSLARAYRYDGNEEWAEAYWDLVEAWIEQNPVQCSVAWGCGQEVAMRWMAILFGAVCCFDSKATTSERLAKVDLLAWQTAERIEANINYAISQENNHALSEAAGLLTVGLLYPELQNSSRWAATGLRVLEKELLRQIYSDGSYVQHSMSYHRVMLDVVLWSQGLLKEQGRSLNERVMARVQESIRWLNEFVDSENGRVPNLGSNDGANVLPLSCSDYLDYRPVLTTAAQMFGVTVQEFGDGAWVEKSLWFGFPQKRADASNEERSVKHDQRATHWQAPIGGYSILRGERSYAMVRAGRYRDRPCQCDMLHVDIWHDHRNILRDTGSFRYYHEDPSVKGYFYSVEAHNTVQVNAQEQMVKGPNFLWFHWPTATSQFRSPNELECCAQFRTATPYAHYRTVHRIDDSYEIVDKVLKGNAAVGEVFRVARWHLSPELAWEIADSAEGLIYGVAGDVAVYTISLSSDGPISVSLQQGWESLYYGERHHVPVLTVQWMGSELSTLFRPDCSEERSGVSGRIGGKGGTRSVPPSQPVA